jgi:hypothetical protein
MFRGVNLFPDVLSKPLELQNGERRGIFCCYGKNMNNFLRDRPMFSVRPCLNLSVQTIRQILYIQGSHRFLHIAAIMEEHKLTVKLPTRDENDCGAIAHLWGCDEFQAPKQIGLTIWPNVVARADKVIK